MKRVFVGLAVAALTVLSFAAPAGATAGSTTALTYHYRGTFANAYWFYGSEYSAPGYSDTSVNVTKSKEGIELHYNQFTIYRDAQGTYLGSSAVWGQATSGFTFTLRPSLAGATLTALGVPAEGWIYDPATGTTTDVNTTVDVTVTWTAQGAIERGVYTSHYSTGDYSYTSHSNGTRRDAATTGTVAGLPVSSADAVYYGASLGTTTEGSTNITFPTR